jgi:hypothetical protein
MSHPTIWTFILRIPPIPRIRAVWWMYVKGFGLK